MAKGFSANMSEGSFTKAINKISKLANEKSKEIDMEMFDYVQSLATMAKQKAPGDGRLRAAITGKKVQPFSYELRADTNYAAYVEFGTGDFYKKYQGRLTNFWRDLASKYYKNGKGTTRPQPFFYPTVRELRPKFLVRLKDILKS